MSTYPINTGTNLPQGVKPFSANVRSRPPRWLMILLGAELLVIPVVAGFFIHFYLQFSHTIDARLAGNVFDNPAVILAAPTEVQVGEKLTASEVVDHLRKAWYTEGQERRGVGSYKIAGNDLEINPGPGSFFSNSERVQGPARLEFKGGRLTSIAALSDMTPLKTYLLEPEEITTLFGARRAKRRLVSFQDLPKSLVDAILATEDHRFYSHHGVDCLRILAAAKADFYSNQRVEGGSTLTMQLARNLFLTPQRTIRRKITEIFFALLLELRLPKNKILELYANQVYLGQRNSFSIYGFGEASTAYFNKDVSALTLPEAALLAGMICGPNLYSPYQDPAQATERRNLVLHRMVEAGFISYDEAEQASNAPLGLTQQNAEAPQEAYFVDMVRRQLLAQFSEEDLLTRGYRIYTTLNLDLQRAATQGARAGMVEVDREVKQQRKRGTPSGKNAKQPQLALVALDPHTGDVKALVGGRSYAASQLNHVLARRQPGSSFKPFVYAAALSSDPTITLATVLKDEPTTFDLGHRFYTPKNYHQSYQSSVTVRQALTYSLNVPSVLLAQMVGYGTVRDFALEAGFNQRINATPSIALGSYVATPLEVAGAYTIFPNNGEYVAPRCIVAVTESSGQTVWDNPVAPRRVLDPRVNYLMVSLLQGVISRGTGAGVRTRGFKFPAGGKTGTSRDGWFAGFTPNLLAVTWVGYDDDHDLKLIGAHSALPIWAEFMKRTTDLPAYNIPQPFAQPTGIVTVALDNDSNLVAPAGSDPMTTHNEVFIEGTEPFPSQPQEVMDVAQASDGASPEGDGVNSNGDDIVLVNEAPGHAVYVNTGATISRASSQPLSPLVSILPANLTTQVEAGAVPAAARNADLSDKGLPDHK